MIPRTLEPEVMDTAEEAHDYNSMDHRQVNCRFVDDFLAVIESSPLNWAPSESVEAPKILDCGTGTALIPIELCQRPVCLHVTAIDMANEMLIVAETNVAKAGLNENIQLERVDAKQLPFARRSFDAVISNSIVHHIPKPREVLAEMARVLKPGGVLFVRDLMRPDDVVTVDRFVTMYAGDENEHQRQMFRDSLFAALRLDEIRDLLDEVGLPKQWATQTTDRHWTIAGIG